MPIAPLQMPSLLQSIQPLQEVHQSPQVNYINSYLVGNADQDVIANESDYILSNKRSRDFDNFSDINQNGQNPLYLQKINMNSKDQDCGPDSKGNDFK